jgi:hypothetical protein
MFVRTVGQAIFQTARDSGPSTMVLSNFLGGAFSSAGFGSSAAINSSISVASVIRGKLNYKT